MWLPAFWEEHISVGLVFSEGYIQTNRSNYPNFFSMHIQSVLVSTISWMALGSQSWSPASFKSIPETNQKCNTITQSQSAVSMYDVGLNIVHDLLRKAEAWLKMSLFSELWEAWPYLNISKSYTWVHFYWRKSKFIQPANQNTLFFVYHMRWHGLLHVRLLRWHRIHSFMEVKDHLKSVFWTDSSIHQTVLKKTLNPIGAASCLQHLEKL